MVKRPQLASEQEARLPPGVPAARRPVQASVMAERPLHGLAVLWEAAARRRIHTPVKVEAERQRRDRLHLDRRE